MARIVLSCIFSILWIFLCGIQAKNFLMFPLHGEGSHYFFMARIGMELVSRGHNVTMLVNRHYEEYVESLDQPFNYEFFNTSITRAEFDYILKNISRACLTGNFSKRATYYAMKNFGYDCTQRHISGCLNILDDAELLSRLKQSRFDLAMADAIVRCPILQYLWQYTGLPHVVFCPMFNKPCAHYLQDHYHVNPFNLPEPIRGMGHRMSFFERITNGALSGVTRFMIDILSAIANPFQSAFPRKVPLALHPNAELCFSNTHFVLDPSPPWLPNTVPVGGLTTRPAQSLDREWEEFLQSAGEYGVVLSSMGTYVRGTDEDIAAVFAEAFAQLPQKVIWEVRGKPAITLPPNVKLVDRIPQNDLLAHPQIKVFVYHCGSHGTWEAVYHGVPMVMLPLFADQPYNALRLEKRGIGIILDVPTLTSNALAEAIRTVINHPSYKRNAKRTSAIYRDNPRTPVGVACDWMEYIIRRHDEKKMASGNLDLNMLKSRPLYVIFVFVVTFITCYLTVLM